MRAIVCNVAATTPGMGQLLIRAVTKINQSFSFKKYYIHLAVIKHNSNMFNLLVQAGAYLDVIDLSELILHLPSRPENLEKIKCLIKAKISLLKSLQVLILLLIFQKTVPQYGGSKY